MTGGVGGLFAVQVTREALKQLQREQRQHLDQLKARQKAMREFRRNSIPSYEEPDRADFFCFQLCGDCGFLAETDQAPCASCSRANWIDLSDETIAGQLREDEEHNRNSISGEVKQFLTLVPAAFSFIVLLFAIFFRWFSLEGLLVFVTTLILYTAILIYLLRLFLSRPLTFLQAKLSPAPPLRYHIAIPLPGRNTVPTSSNSGVARQTDKTLTAPFSRRSCLAWRVSILFDVKGDARPPEWVVLDEKNTAFSVGETLVPRGKAHFHKSFTREPILLPEDSPELSRFLRQRGLFAIEGDYWVFESLVEPETEITVETYSETDVVVLHPPAIHP